MPGLLQSSAVLAVAAYARVNADGSSPDMNSGVATERSSQGVYVITLPVSLEQPLVGVRDLVMLTIRVEDGSFDFLTSLNYQWLDGRRIEVHGFSGGGEGPGASDLPFDFILFRSTISPPLDAPA